MNILSFATDNLFTTYYIIGQVFTVLGYLLHFVCFCLPKKTQIVILECVSKAFNIAAFFFLDSLAGILSNAVMILRGVTVFFREKYNKKLIWCYVVIMLMLIGCGVLSFNNVWSICAFLPILISTTTTWFWGPQGIRVGQMAASVVYLIFLISLPNIAGIALECVVIVICVTTFLLYRYKIKLQQKQEDLAATDENAPPQSNVAEEISDKAPKQMQDTDSTQTEQPPAQ